MVQAAAITMGECRWLSQLLRDFWA